MIHEYLRYFMTGFQDVQYVPQSTPKKTLVAPTKIKHAERNIGDNAGNDWESVGFTALYANVHIECDMKTKNDGVSIHEVSYPPSYMV